ncbi:transposase family protein [Actinacidiphila oryziradicis]
MKTLITRLWHRRPDRGRGRPWALSYADRVLLVALAYRTNLTTLQLGLLFDISDSAVHRTIADFAPHLAARLGPPPTDKRELWLVDGTLIPVHDKKRTAKSKNYRRSVNTEVVRQARDRRVVAVGKTWPGNRNDVVVFRETVGQTLPPHPPVCPVTADTGASTPSVPLAADPTGRSSRPGPPPLPQTPRGRRAHPRPAQGPPDPPPVPTQRRRYRPRHRRHRRAPQPETGGGRLNASPGPGLQINTDDQALRDTS